MIHGQGKKFLSLLGQNDSSVARQLGMENKSDFKCCKNVKIGCHFGVSFESRKKEIIHPFLIFVILKFLPRNEQILAIKHSIRDTKEHKPKGKAQYS
jgi:hypothetical protein